MTAKDRKDDIFMLQVRLYRMFQSRRDLSADECNRIFAKYELFDYISRCYEEYHMQGDEANYEDMLQYMKRQGFR